VTTQQSLASAGADACELRTVHPERVEATRARMITPDGAGRMAERFRLLGDPGRLRMVYALLEAGELCVCDLAAVVEAGESAISHQLRQLRAAGLVKFRKEGRVVYYSVDDAHIRLLLDVAEQHYLHLDDGHLE
jgi:ArsR family transcriptional regulator, lead/cadmium/zinc/bismuth-responsive transcriptional repressor